MDADPPPPFPTAVPPNVPAFTDEDERRELQSLTIKEIADIEQDLRGITSDVNGLRLGSSAVGPDDDEEGEKDAECRKKRKGDKETMPRRTPAARRTSLDDLSKLELEILRMPPDAKESYVEACLKCPELLTPEHKTAFIEYSSFDTHEAAIRLCEYWKIRVATFGADRAFLPMTLAGAMKDEVKGMIEYCPMQILPMPDLSGRPVLFFNPCRRNFEQFSQESEARSLFYLIDCLCFTDESARKAGFVGIAIGRRVERKSLSLMLLKFNMHLIGNVMPIRLRSCHIVYPSPALYYLIWPVMRYIIGKEQRLRWIFHNGDEDSLIHDLEGYRFHRARLPKEVGGGLEVDTHQWVADRSVKESFVAVMASAEEENAKDALLKHKPSPQGSAQAADLPLEVVGSSNFVMEQHSTAVSDIEATKARIISQFNSQLLASSSTNPGLADESGLEDDERKQPPSSSTLDSKGGRVDASTCIRTSGAHASASDANANDLARKVFTN